MVYMAKTNLVILHGWSREDTPVRWQPVKAALEKSGFKVFLPILPGFFGSPEPKSAWTLSDYADFIRQYLNQESIDNPFILGHSFGGSLALKFALQSKLAKGLILVNSSGIRQPSLKAGAFRLASNITKPIFKLPLLSSIKPFLDWLVYTLAREKDYYLASPKMKLILKNLLAEDLTPWLHKINLPVLIIWGSQDKTTLLTHGQIFHKTIPNSQIKIIPHASHALPFQSPRLLAQAVTQFAQNL